MNHPQRVRRSWLLTPASDDVRIKAATQSAADVVVLDLVEFVPETVKPSAREGLAGHIANAGAGGADVFAQVDPALLYADLQACVCPELTGVIVSRMESAAQIDETDNLLAQLEEERGIVPGTLEIVASLETAKGNHNAFQIATASPRISGLTLGRAELVMDLRPEPSGEIHLMQYLMQRLIIVAGAVGVVPYGAWWRAPDRGLLATPENTAQAAIRGRAIGFKGSMCVLEDQAEPLNRGFTPSPEEAGRAQELLDQYRAASQEGNSAWCDGDRIFDAGAARQAQSLVAWEAACAVRDQAKAAARAGTPVPAP